MNETGNEYYQHIAGLMIPKISNYATINESINKYIDVVQELAEGLEKAYENRADELFVQFMEIAIEMLDAVHARWLKTEGVVILRSFKGGRESTLKPRIKPFVTDMLSLSIEMQRIQNLANNELLEETDNKVGQHTDMAQNLSAVGTLLGEGDYEQAQSMITELEDRSPEAMLVSLLEMVASQQYEEAGKLANILKEKHMEAINTFVASAGEQKMVLAVDDRPEILSGINTALKEHYKVFGVTSGNSALELLKSKTPDLFILDIDMPEMDGFELIDAIRKNPEHTLTPIVFLTGNSSRKYVVRAMQAGVNDFIVKPTRHDVLLTKVRKYLT